MNIVFVINNKKSRAQKMVHKLDAHCQDLNVNEVSFNITLRKGHAIELAKQATDNGCNFLIAVGGDGTLHEIVNGVLKSKIPVNNYPVIGLLPFGSANDFARTARITKSIETLFQLINSNSSHKIDLGRIILTRTKEIHHFINIAGIGLGPEVVQNMEKGSSLLGSSIQYFKSILSGFYKYEKKKVICSSSDWKWEGKLLQMAVANAKYYGNGICTAPDANLSDGLLDVVCFGDLSVWDYLKNLGKLKKGVKLDLSEVSYYQSGEIEIESTEKCGIEADGEFTGNLPVKISVIPKAIYFLMPKPI